MTTTSQEPQSTRRAHAIGLIMTAVSLFLLAASTIGFAREYRFVRTAKEAEAMVVGMIQREEIQCMFYAPVYVYRDSEGHSHRIESLCASYPPAYHSGQTINILYNPASPSDTQIKAFSSQWGTMTAMAVVALLGILISINLACGKSVTA